MCSARRQGTRQLSWCIQCIFLLDLFRQGFAATQYFEVVQYRSPTQCTRAQCLSVRSETCREQQQGIFLREKGCQNGQLCTNCVYGNGSSLTTCSCENPPYAVPALYNEQCTTGKECAQGQGICYRPCGTFLHITTCPSLWCQWNTNKLLCEPRAPPVPTVYWTSVQTGLSVQQEADKIVSQNMAQHTSIFPMSFASFWQGASGYRIQGVLLQNVSSPESIFLQLDLNIDGQLTATEFAGLPAVLTALNQAVTDTHQDQVMMARRLQMQLAVSPEVCNARKPRQYYCSFDVSCKLDCKECGWKTAFDQAFSVCVQPTPEVCNADFGKVYCATDQMCHPPGDCSECVDRPIVDHAQHVCLAIWWKDQPLTSWSDWVCRYRHKVGMPCISDQDCINGLRQCLNGQCMPFQPYNPNQTCSSDYDCPHLGYYCPEDPTGGQDPYWVQYCRLQRTEGMTCQADRECGPSLRCNTAEPQSRCRTLFSLPTGSVAASDELCMFGWRDLSNKCAPAAKSKQASRYCDSDSDCVTTDATGRTGNCMCKAWWDHDDDKYCMPVAGDYANHLDNLRSYWWFRSKNCGSFWTEDECLTIFGNQALKLKLAVECETQKLAGGPYIPPSECSIQDETRFPNPCAQLQALR